MIHSAPEPVNRIWIRFQYCDCGFKKIARVGRCHESRWNLKEGKHASGELEFDQAVVQETWRIQDGCRIFIHGGRHGWMISSRFSWERMPNSVLNFSRQLPAPSKMSNRLPSELCNEIICYLWNEHPHSACCLANQIMTVPSQKRLFYCICLRAPKIKLEPIRIRREWNKRHFLQFLETLVRSPHIAKYVQSLFIMDYGSS